MMRNCYLGLVMTMLGNSAFAADLNKAPPFPPTSPFIASPWDGLYIGGNIGFGSTNFDAGASAFAGSLSATQNATGVLGGVQLGYNKTFGTWLIGLETDFDATGLNESTNNIQTSLPWFGTTRLRAGFLLTPAWLIYGTGGVAYGSAQITAPLGQVNVSGVGWTAGGGVEYAFGNGWSIGAEYLHVHLDGPNANVGALNLDTNADTDIGRAKINYHF